MLVKPLRIFLNNNGFSAQYQTFKPQTGRHSHCNQLSHPRIKQLFLCTANALKNINRVVT